MRAESDRCNPSDSTPGTRCKAGSLSLGGPATTIDEQARAGDRSGSRGSEVHHGGRDFLDRGETAQIFYKSTLHTLAGDVDSSSDTTFFFRQARRWEGMTLHPPPT